MLEVANAFLIVAVLFWLRRLERRSEAVMDLHECQNNVNRAVLKMFDECLGRIEILEKQHSAKLFNFIEPGRS